MSHIITNPKFVQRKSRRHEVAHILGNVYEVTSGASGEVYTVRLHPDGQGASCSCHWGHYRPRSRDDRSGCSHVIAVLDSLDEVRRVSAWTDPEQARRQHRPTLAIGDGLVLTSRKVRA
jgi:hypothetical protein